jgi:hypothetical protein
VTNKKENNKTFRMPEPRWNDIIKMDLNGIGL